MVQNLEIWRIDLGVASVFMVKNIGIRILKIISGTGWLALMLADSHIKVPRRRTYILMRTRRTTVFIDNWWAHLKGKSILVWKKSTNGIFIGKNKVNFELWELFFKIVFRSFLSFSDYWPKYGSDTKIFWTMLL